MKHRVVGRRLDRTTEHRTAMFRNMVTSLIEHERITTTAPKAKELKRIADKIITLAKKGGVHARRLEDAGYVLCEKTFAGRTPRTEYRLSAAGRRAFEKYLDHMDALIKAARRK